MDRPLHHHHMLPAQMWERNKQKGRSQVSLSSFNQAHVSITKIKRV